jgi:hypothetical protein
MPDPARDADVDVDLAAVEPRYFLSEAAAHAARKDLTRHGFACMIAPAWALLAVGPAPGAPAPLALPLPIEAPGPPEPAAEVEGAAEPEPEPAPPEPEPEPPRPRLQSV